MPDQELPSIPEGRPSLVSPAQRAIGVVKMKYSASKDENLVSPGHFIPLEEARWLSSPKKVGSSSVASASSGVMKAQGKGYKSGRIRPCLLLQLALQSASKYSPTKKQENEKALITWINDNLGGEKTIFTITPETRAGEKIALHRESRKWKSSVDKLSEQEAVQSEIATVVQDSGKVKSNVDELVNAITEVTRGTLDSSIGDVKDAVSSVVSSIPMLGTIVAGAKLILKVVDLAGLVYEAYKISEAKGNTISQVEFEVLEAVQSFQKKRGVVGVKDLIARAAGTVSAALGVGVASEAATRSADLLINIILKTLHFLEMRKTNEVLQKSSLTIEKLRSLPTLGLHLPHLTGIDTLALLGILPPGWQTGSQKVDIQERLKEISSGPSEHVTSEELVWLKTSLNWTRESPIEKSNPWYEEYYRIVYMLEKTDKYLNTQGWRLCEKDSLTPIYLPASTGFIEKTNERLKAIFTSSSSATPILPPITRQHNK
jgi:hypothetical protein